jgi:hypothetical protein
VAGYSPKPLHEKLGIKAGHRVAVLGLPDGLDLGIPAEVQVATRARGTFDVIVSFHTSRASLDARIPTLLEVLDVDGAIWMAWPKRASGVDTDLTEDVQREVWLPLGLVDTKVCAIDDVWSGLRLCWRKERRDDLRAGQRRPTPS